MNRNVSIVVVILVLVVIAGYLVWLRSRVAPLSSEVVEQTEEIIATPTPRETATASATPSGTEATSGARQETSTSSSKKR